MSRQLEKKSKQMAALETRLEDTLKCLSDLLEYTESLQVKKFKANKQPSSRRQEAIASAALTQFMKAKFSEKTQSTDRMHGRFQL